MNLWVYVRLHASMRVCLIFSLALNASSTLPLLLMDFLTSSPSLEQHYTTIRVRGNMLYFNRQADRKSPGGGFDHFTENWIETK